MAWATGHDEVVPRHGLSDQVRLTADELHIDQTHVGTPSEDVADNFTRVGQKGPRLESWVGGDRPVPPRLRRKSRTEREHHLVRVRPTSSPADDWISRRRSALAGEYSCTALQKYVPECSGLDTVGAAVVVTTGLRQPVPRCRRSFASWSARLVAEGLRALTRAEACQRERVLDQPEFDHDARSVSSPFANFHWTYSLPVRRRARTLSRSARPQAWMPARPMINGLRRPNFEQSPSSPGLHRQSHPRLGGPGDEGVLHDPGDPTQV